MPEIGRRRGIPRLALPFRHQDLPDQHPHRGKRESERGVDGFDVDHDRAYSESWKRGGRPDSMARSVSCGSGRKGNPSSSTSRADPGAGGFIGIPRLLTWKKFFAGR